MYLKSNKEKLYSRCRYSFKVQTSILLQAFIPTVQVKYKNNIKCMPGKDDWV